MPEEETFERARLHKAVIHFRDELIMGYANKTQWSAHAREHHTGKAVGPPSIAFHREGATALEVLSLADAKAVFFVNSFEGNRSHNNIRFHDDNPLMRKIWVRITFADAEVMEGMIENTLEHLCGSGFYFRPTDPAGNNYLAYIIKKQIVDFKVLGLSNEAAAVSDS